MKNLRVAAAQMEHRDGDQAANLATVERLARQAAEQGAQIVAFPECCLTGYWHLRTLSRDELTALAEPLFAGPSSQRLGRLAAELGLTIGAGLVELAPDGRLYNSYVVAMPDGGFARHRKLHAFVSPHLSCGDEFTVFDTPLGCRLGVLICYDNNLIENVRISALLGAEVLLAPHQTGGCKTASPHAMGLVEPALWERRAERPDLVEAEFRGPKGREWLLRWLPSRAHDNGLFVVFSNGVGRDDNEVRTGGAMVLDPYGRILAETWVPREALVVCDLDADLRPTSTGARWLTARRPELYGLLAQPTGRERPIREVRFQGIAPEAPQTTPTTG